jgi:hypothetical protein
MSDNLGWKTMAVATGKRFFGHAGRISPRSAKSVKANPPRGPGPAIKARIWSASWAGFSASPQLRRRNGDPGTMANTRCVSFIQIPGDAAHRATADKVEQS